MVFNTMTLCCCRLREKKLSWVDIFEEIPVCTLIFSFLSYMDESSLSGALSCLCPQIKVSNSALVSAFMKELEPESPVTQV